MKAILNKKKIVKGTNIKVPLTCGSSNNYFQGKFVDGNFYLLKSNGTFSEISMVPIEGKKYEDVTTGKIYKWNGSKYEEVDLASVDEPNMTEVKYSELVELRNNSKLVPGKFYRITDYQCTTVQENTRSVDHQFDIVLLALSKNELAEEGWAMMHESDIYDVTFAYNVTLKCYLYKIDEDEDYNYYNIVSCDTLLGKDYVAQFKLEDTNFVIDEEKKTAICPLNSDELTTPNLTYNYFQNSKLEAWKVWYCLDNDTNRFAWAKNKAIEGLNIRNTTVPLSSAIFSRNSAIDTTGNIRNGSSNVQLYGWVTNSQDSNFTNRTVFTLTDKPTLSTTVYIKDVMFDDYYATVNYRINGFEYSDGKGVIYRLIDEFNNDIKYDFKNIQFKRTITDGQYDEDGEETWCYTINVWYQDMCQDASVIGNTLPNEDEIIIGVHSNIFGHTYASVIFYEGNGFALGNNVVLSINDEDTGYAGIFSNKVGNGFYNNTLARAFNNNTIGNKFHDNICTSVASFTNNIIGDGFSSNTINGSFQLNIIGFNCISNIFSTCINNIIGNYFMRNNIGSEFSYNIINNYVRYNIIGNSFQFNKIGNSVTNIITGTGTTNGYTLKDYIKYISIEDGVMFVNITTSQTTSNIMVLCNIVVGKGLKGDGDDNRKTITHPTVNDTFQTTYLPTGSTTVNV